MHGQLLDVAGLFKSPTEPERSTASRWVVRWGMIAASATTLQLLEEIELYGPERAPVLITGETGTGKEKVAQALHEASGRRGRMIAVNCGAVSPDLIESLLFGYVRGAFTGANSEKKGYFEEADGGTIFLDEIGDMPMKAQVALLRVLQEKKICRLGAVQEKEIDVRVVAATHCNLETMVAEGTFRTDLYYRLRGLAIHILPLRERRDEIPALIDYCLHKIGEERGQRLEITEEAIAALLEMSWRGNVRELIQCLEAAAVRARGGRIDLQALALRPEAITSPAQAMILDRTTGDELPHATLLMTMPIDSGGERFRTGKTYAELMDDYERCLLQDALDACGGNVARAANVLKMSAITMRRRIRILGVERRSQFVALSFAARGQSFQVREDLDKAV